MKILLKKFWTDDRGATAIEYALIAGVVSVGIVASLHEMAPLINAQYENISDAFDQGQ
ncbi:Flp family type IVb pilin [Hyphomicrobium zavarzinii]|jgi:pilus assembly protein Flp/PilA|nr:Flp family type IVb pilin [Hyphomicrobium zavarzinii]